jgi:hypothetical protein
MGIEVPTSDSPKGSRVSWLVGAGVAIVIGLILSAGTLAGVRSWGGLAAAAILVIPGLLYLIIGAKVILRVTGIGPESRIRALVVTTFSITAAVASLSTVATLFFYALSKSVIEHEGGTPTSDPENILIATGILALVTVGAFVLAIISTRIDDPPRGKAS